jgi:hypothetical membrane protein
MKDIALRVAGVVAALSFVVAVAVSGAALEGYRQALHPVALLGGDGVPHAWTFNLFAFVLPGAIAACIAMALRGALPRDVRWSVRIGARLALLAAIAFAAQGLLALDPGDLEAPATRLHATVWTLWWVAFVPGAALLALGLRGTQGWRGLAVASALAALLALLFAAWPLQGLPAGIAQRVAYAAWFAWLVACGMSITTLRRASRGAA